MTGPIGIAYLVAGLTFILGIKLLGSPVTARRGNWLAAAGMTVAIVATFFYHDVYLSNLWFIIPAIAVGAVVGVGAARMVKMTDMPQMVAIFNGMGGGAAAMISILEFLHTTLGHQSIAAGEGASMALGTAIGSVSFAGSIIAFAKLQELMKGNFLRYTWVRGVNILLVAGVVILGSLIMTGSTNVWLLAGVAVLGLILGFVLVLPIGGADMPVVISLMNSLTGLAAALTGFVLNNELLIVAGALVGASGTMLTQLMAKAMNRPLSNVLFAGFGGEALTAGPAGATGTVREITAEDAAMLMLYSHQVVIVPGYGLAVAQAQHQVRELSDLLIENGVTVKYAIHPVAGRMPGHMNVLLAEADVPYDQVYEMDQINGEMPSTDVALIVGANDITNPGARDDPSSAIYGMPIINVDYAQHVIVLKRSMRPGFAGIDNPLYLNPKTAMLFGDAKESLGRLVASVKSIAGPRAPRKAVADSAPQPLQHDRIRVAK